MTSLINSPQAFIITHLFGFRLSLNSSSFLKYPSQTSYSILPLNVKLYKYRHLSLITMEDKDQNKCIARMVYTFIR